MSGNQRMKTFLYPMLAVKFCGIGVCAALMLLCTSAQAKGALPAPGADPDLTAAWTHYQDGALPQAGREYERAARRGQAIGQYNFATMLMNGEGMAQNPARARYWLRRAAKQGLAVAQYDEGLLYENGEGVTKSQPRAVYWYRLASRQGNADAQMALATQYYLGRGVKQNYPAAALWYERAAEAGVEPAQYIIASCYEHGDGVPRDLKRAIYWYQRAASQGDIVAIDKVRTLTNAPSLRPMT